MRNVNFNPTGENEYLNENSKVNSKELLILYVISSAIALGLEISWYRIVSQSWSNMSSVFSIVLTFYLLGIVIGSFAFAKLSRKFITNTYKFFCTLQLIACTTTVFGLYVYKATNDQVGRTTLELFRSVHRWIFYGGHNAKHSFLEMTFDISLLIIGFLFLITIR